jgi:hypothetical protein
MLSYGPNGVRAWPQMGRFALIFRIPILFRECDYPGTVFHRDAGRGLLRFVPVSPVGKHVLPAASGNLRFDAEF